MHRNQGLRYAGITLSILLVIAVLIALSAAGNVELDRPVETEADPNRSSYNAGLTGTRAFYQLLEESNLPVGRWRDSFDSLKDKARNATLILVGPFQFDLPLAEQEARQLQSWVATGGQLLVVSRSPYAQFGDTAIHAQYEKDLNGWETPPAEADRYTNPRSDEFIVQPTDLTRDLQGLLLSRFASRLRFYADVSEAEAPLSTDAPTPPPTPAASAEPVPSPVESAPSPTPIELLEDAIESEPEGWEFDTLYAPVVHLGDKDGAVLAEFEYGEGRVVFLSDPFIIANNGISRGANLTLALNLVRSLGDGGRQLLFDEYHHGYRSAANPLFNYFRGTPMPWLLLQGGLLSLLLIYTYGKRFARPLPLPQADRHSPLEFVGSMANLQQAAQARDLALENIYPRFKTKLCRRLGLSSQARIEEIVESAKRSHLPLPADELGRLLKLSETVLKGGAAAQAFDDAQLVNAVATMRRVLAHLKG